MRGFWSKLSFLLLILYTGVLLYGTLKPFQFTWHPRRDRMNGRSQVEWIPFTHLCPTYGIFCPHDTGLNIAIFVPVGVWAALLGGGGAGAVRRTLQATALGFGLSLLIETTQYFIPSRYPSATDLVLNTLGAGLGAVSVALLLRKIRPLTADR